jgi:tetratricopeptide (TPR) repeat protein
VVIADYVYYTKVHRSLSGDRILPANPDNLASRGCFSRYSMVLLEVTCLLMDDMNQNLIDKLLIDLKSSDENIRERATSQLWRIWFWEKGKIPLEQIEESERLLAEGDIDGAGAILDELVTDLPDFAEAWNRRAVWGFVTQKYERAIADCERVLKLNPVHFGALHGLGLCHAALGNYSAAIGAFRSALEIQPHAVENQRLLLECTARLS